MKKIYLLVLLSCLCLSAFSQTTVIVYAGPGLLPIGTYVTGRATSTTRTATTMIASTTSNCYAVFDLSGIPAGSVVSSVVTGIYVTPSSGSAPCNTYVYQGDLSTVTTSPPLYTNMVAPAATLVDATSYGAATGAITLATNPATEAAIQAGTGGIISMSFTTTGPSSYTITGANGAAAISGSHTPFLQITYCPPPSITSTTVSPVPVCDGQPLSLDGIVAGATDYLWTGPDGSTATTLSASVTASPASAGVFTLVATNTCGTVSATATATTTVVTVNPLPLPITGVSAICLGSATTLHDATFGGGWSSSNTAVGSIGNVTGLVVGEGVGTATMTYTLPATGCYVTFPMTVNNAPSAISGPTEVCENSSINLTNTSSGGTWTSAFSNVSIVSAGTTSAITGVNAGPATITYTPGGCPFATYNITVNAIPSPISGASDVCQGSSTTMTDPDPGGTWNTSSSGIAFAGAGTGLVTGVSAGPVNIIYTFIATGCRITMPFFVDPLPAPISGPASVCIGDFITLTDATPGGTFSGGAPRASVTPGGIVTGVSRGPSTITYTDGTTGCRITTAVAVNTPPAPISGTLLVCQSATVTLSDPDPGGTWSSFNPAIASAAATTGVVTGNAIGSTNISYTVASTGCAAVVNVTVNPTSPSAITPPGPIVFCAGGNVTLDGTSTVYGPFTYQWSDSGHVIVGATDATFTASNTGAYTVIVTNSFNCALESVPVNVTAGVSPVITHTTPLGFCIGNNVVLTADAGPVAGILSYQWNKGGVPIPGATSATYTADSVGSYTAYVVVSGITTSCAATTPAATVTVHNYPTPSITSTGAMLKTANTYATYQWFLNGVSITGATNYTYVPAVNGSYRVRVGDIIGCPGFSNAYMIGGVGISQLNADEIRIFPNPANELVYVEAPVSVHAILTDMAGKTLADKNDVSMLDIKAFAPGLYLLRLYDMNGNCVKVQKLEKQ